MRGKHEKGASRLTFANMIIAICLGVGLFITVEVLCEYHRLDTVVPGSVLTALLGLWGGELLVIALRQIFGSDAISKAKTEKYNQNYNDGLGGSI